VEVHNHNYSPTVGFSPATSVDEATMSNPAQRPRGSTFTSRVSPLSHADLIRKERALVADVVQTVQEFKPPTGNCNTDDLKKFCKELPKTIAAIDEKTREITLVARTDRQECEQFVQGQALVEDQVEFWSNKADTTANSRDQTIAAIKEEFVTNLHGVIAILGQDTITNIIKSELGLYLKTKPENNQSPLPASPPPTIHQNIIGACRASLPNARRMVSWDLASVCGLITNTKQFISELQKQIRDSESVAVSSARAAYLYKETSSIVHPLNNADDIPQSSQVMSVNSPPRPVSKQPETHGLDSSTPESDDTATADLAELLSQLELAHSKLQSSLALAQVQLSSSQVENIKCKALLIRNHQFGLQLDDNTIERYSRELREHRTLDPPEDPPFLKCVTALTLADDFDNRGLRPIVPYSIRYIHTINEDIWRAEEELDPHRRQRQVQRAIEQHLPWLTTRLSDLVIRGADDDYCLLACFVRHIIFGQDTIASSLLRSLLFMLVANLSQRSEQIRLATLWWDVYEATLNGNFAQPYQAWNLLDRMTFAWFLSVGKDVTIGSLVLTGPQLASLSDLITDLRDSNKTDFLKLLLSPCVRAFAQSEDMTRKSIIVSTSNTYNEQLVIMRTTNSTSEELVQEYIWTKHGGKIWFSQRGFEVDAKGTPPHMIPCVQAVNETPGPWFSIVDQDIASYFDKYHRDDLLAAAQRIRRMYQQQH